MPNRPDIISPDLEDALRKLARSVRPISDTAVRRSWTRRQHTGYQPTPHAGAYVMSYNDSTHWRARAEGMRVLAEETKGGISKYVMRRIAADYEWFARTIEQRPIRRIPIPAVVPAEVKRFGPSKNSVGAPPPGKIPDLEIPSFLKRGPATAEEAGAFA